ncbi:PREDICTED: testis-expressed sequence 36 protein [Nanorana parkeri]|uniref:testis-expressed sequence 36 protein n=1 Tax=Nanorana parkeri TaxID=125878 RepID=UPI0008548A00|nr:PREDICTED: testis-expressed sequence 36 protein [Nanorana parkeri]
MPKGRLCMPSAEKDGLWFPHIGVSMKLPVTSTQDMLHHAKSASWKEQRLPLICVSCNKNEVQNGFPFSSHDNRHIIQGSGEYLDSGVGKRKTPHETRQQSSRNFNLSCHSTPLKPSSCWNGFSNYQISFRGRQDTEAPFCRRYPKHHHERSARIRDHPEDHFMWFGGSHGLS